MLRNPRIVVANGLHNPQTEEEKTELIWTYIQLYARQGAPLLSTQSRPKARFDKTSCSILSSEALSIGASQASLWRLGLELVVVEL